MASSVIDPAYKASDYFPIDLSVHNPVWNELDITSIADFEKYLKLRQVQTGGKIAYGGFFEKRGLYRNSEQFTGERDRNIHLGMDLWAPAGTSVHAYADGVLHSFAHNKGNGNYGPTIILEHENKDGKFYSLYGHLSLESLDGLREGLRFRESEKIATLGKPAVNGGYSPHLHFQLMKDMLGNRGDFPGVASDRQLEKLRSILIDPTDLVIPGR